MKNPKLSTHPKRGRICFLMGIQVGIVIGIYIVALVK